MKKHILAGMLVIVTASSVAGQEVGLYSTPSLPPREVLDRLNLRMAWNVNVPMDGRRDGFASVQINNGQVIAQTRSGVIATYDAETGRKLWSIVVGKPYEARFQPAMNVKSMFVISGVTAFAVDRNSGALQWEVRLPFGISSAPVSDDYRIYLSSGSGRVSAYQLPAVSTLETPGGKTRDQKELEALATGETQPRSMWDALTQRRLQFPPLMTRDLLFYATPLGNVFSLGKFPIADQPAEVYRFQLEGNLTIAPGVFEETAYIPVDSQLFAFTMPNGKIQWRYTAGTAITRTPFITDADIYLTAERKGVIRLDRETGEAKWKIPSGRTTTTSAIAAERVLAVNNKFVYATDRAGRLLVLDRKIGTQLSQYEPFRDYAYPVVNDVTDRLFLAANNGLLLCLHDREYAKPLVQRSFDYVIKPSADRIRALKEKLARKITDKGADGLPLVEVLESYKRRYGIEIFISDKAFRDAGLSSINSTLVIQPRVENLELSTVLKDILAEVGATYEVTGDIVQVIPPRNTGVAAKPAPGPGPTPNPVPAPKPNPNQPPPVDPILKETLARKVNPPVSLEKAPLGDMLTYYADRFDLKFDVDDKGFKASGTEEVLKREVIHPKGQGIPFAQVLRELLSQVKGDYDVQGNTIVIVPVKK